MEVETEQQQINRSRMGKLVAFLTVAWWVIAIGGIIFVIESNK